MTMRCAVAAAILTTTILVLGPTSMARAQGVDNTRTVFFSIGTGLGLSGNVHNEATGTVLEQPTVIVEQSFSNIYSDGLRVRVGGSVGFDYNKEFFGTFNYGRLNANNRLVGSIAGYALEARFANARTIDLEGGVRFYMNPEGPVRTYVAAVGGLRFLDEITATLLVKELGITLEDRPFYKSSTLFIFGGDAGMSREISPTVDIGAEVGLRYQPKPGQADLLLGEGLDEVNDAGSRWSLPISVFLTWRF